MGPAPLIRSKAIVSPAEAPPLGQENVGFVLRLLSKYCLSGDRLGGAPRRSQLDKEAAEGQGQPLSLSLCLAWVAQGSPNPAQHRAGCVGGGEGILGRHIPLLYFGKIAFVNSVSSLTIK